MSCAALAGWATLAACTLHDRPASSGPSLAVDQGSFRMSFPVDAAGTIHLSDQAPLSGTLDVSPILEAEGTRARRLQVVMHLGRFYIAADGFRHIWEVAPRPGERTAVYRSVPLPPGAVDSAVRLSRYGPPGRACLRLDADGRPPWFLTADGVLDVHCP